MKGDSPAGAGIAGVAVFSMALCCGLTSLLASGGLAAIGGWLLGGVALGGVAFAAVAAAIAVARHRRRDRGGDVADDAIAQGRGDGGQPG